MRNSLRLELLMCSLHVGALEKEHTIVPFFYHFCSLCPEVFSVLLFSKIFKILPRGADFQIRSRVIRLALLPALCRILSPFARKSIPASTLVKGRNKVLNE